MSGAPKPSVGRIVLLWVRRVLLFGSLAALLAGVAGALFVVLTIRHYEARVPSVEQLRAGYAPPQVTRVVARDGTVLASLFTERRTVVPLSDVPDGVKLAFLAAEDARFYEHQGLNYIGMLRALYVNLRSGKAKQGGSTITQQVVKNVLLGTNQRTYERKIKEAILARRLEQNLSKDEIFSLYLNHIYFGGGRYGVEEAARYYFGKKASQLELAEGALLAGIVASPERLNPRASVERALERRRYVLGQMLEKGFVTRELHERATAAPLRVAPAVEGEAELAPEVVAYAQRLLREVAGERAQRGGFTITTTLDPALQAAARQALRQNLDDYLKRQKLAPPYTISKRRLWGALTTGMPRPHHAAVGTVIAVDDAAGTIDVRAGDLVGRIRLTDEARFNPQRLPPSAFAHPGAALRVLVLPPVEGERFRTLQLDLGPQSALVALDVRSREVRALVGSYEALMGGLDRATQTKRQPGSAFKPFVYSYALHSRRFSPASILTLPADPKELPDTDAGVPDATRMLSLRLAVARSDNAAAQHVLAAVGAANVVQWARACGIESPLAPTPSLALGAYEVTPLELAVGYTTIAAGGEYAPPVLVTKIVGPDGVALNLPELPPRRRVMTTEEAYLTTSLLKGVIEQGTGKRALGLGRPLAGKTGTTNEAKDAWFAGYSTELAAVVWVGYDSPLGLGPGEQGGATALPAWIELMKTAHRGRPAADFPRPSSIAVVPVDPATGLLPYEGQEDAVEEEFLPDAIPQEHAAADAGVPEEPDAEVPPEEPPGPSEADAGVPEPPPDDPPPF